MFFTARRRRYLEVVDVLLFHGEDRRGVPGGCGCVSFSRRGQEEVPGEQIERNNFFIRDSMWFCSITNVSLMKIVLYQRHVASGESTTQSAGTKMVKDAIADRMVSA